MVKAIENIEEVAAEKRIEAMKAAYAAGAKEAVRADVDTVRKTEEISPQIIENVDLVSGTDIPIHPARASTVDSLSDKEVVERAWERCPDAALEMLKLLLLKEKHHNKQLNDCIAKVDQLRHEISQINALNKLIGRAKGDEVLNQTDEVKALLKELNLEFDGNTTVAEARIHLDALNQSKKTDLSIPLTSELPGFTQQMASWVDIMRDVLRKKEKLNDAIQNIIRR